MKQFIKPIRIHIFLNILCSVLANIALAALPFFIQELLNGRVTIAVIGYVGCSLLFVVFNYFQMRIEWKQAIIFSSAVKNRWYDALQCLSHSEFTEKSVPEYISYQSNDLDALEKDYLPPLVSLFKQLLRIVIFSVIIGAVVNITVAVILFISSLLAIQIPKILGKKIADRRTVYLDKQGDYYDKLDDLLSAHHLMNERTIPSVTAVQRKSLGILQENYFKYGLTKTLGFTLTGLSFKLTDIILFVYLAYSISRGEMTVAQIVAGFSYIDAFSEPIQEILYDIQMLESVKPIKQSFLDMLARPSSSKQPIDSFKQLELRNIHKSLGEKSLSISSLTINYGDKIALVGENGTGKSSLLNILNGVDHHFSGKILLDGQPIENLDGCFGKIIQKEHAFKASYEDNISLFGAFPIQVASEEYLSKDAQNLSGGEKQRMFLEREINQDSPFITMDEPFSALDESQFNLQLQRILALENTVIVTIHQHDQVLPLFSQVWHIADGRVSVEELRE